MNEIFFTVLVYVDNDEELEKAINGIMNVSDDMAEGIKIVVIDPLCSELSIAISQKMQDKYGCKNFVYIAKEGASIGEAYNIALSEIKGRYVNFSMSSMCFQQGAVECALEAAMELERPKLISIAPWTVNEKGEYVRYGMSPISKENGYERISLEQEPARLQLLLHAYFIRCYIVTDNNRKMSFKEELADDAPMEFLLNILEEYQNYIYLPNVKIHYINQLEDNTSAFVNQHHKWWYLDSLKYGLLPFAEQWSKNDWPLKKCIRIALYYLVATRFLCNYNDRNKGVLDGTDLEEFFSLAGQVFNYIDNDLIWTKTAGQTFEVPRTLRILFFKLKAKERGNQCEVVRYKNDIYLWTHRNEKVNELFDEKDKEAGYRMDLFTVCRENGQLPIIEDAYNNVTFNRLSSFEKEHVLLKAVNYHNGRIEIDGTFSMGDLIDRESVKLKLIKNGKESVIKYSEVYGLNKVFGKTYNHIYQFHVGILANSLKDVINIQFGVEMNGITSIVEIRTPKAYAHVKVGIAGQYWRFCDNWCMSVPNKKLIVLKKLSQKGMEQCESDYRKELTARSKKGSIAAKQALEIRKRYFEEKANNPDARIWITFDKLYKAGDNGEYAYNYITQQEDGIDIYYIIKEDSVDYERMRAAGANLLIWGEQDTLVKVLLSEVVLATHSDVLSYAGFEKDIVPYICDLYNPVNVCIQHGLTTQNIAQYQNRVFDNLHLYTCASPNEIANLSKPIYGFEDKSVLKLTGLARYDGLKNNDQRQILITPTWRRNIANASVAHIKKGHNEYFKNSEYYKIYNGLINDERLIDCAKMTGYSIIYLLHPAASSQVDDFEKNDYVKIIPAASDMNYEKILTESSLMVTDYSGVQFDFAYMRKPILYYHPKSLPPHYDESEAYVYERDAFGPLIDNHEELVDALCEYMRNDCKTEVEYIDRADKFFAFDDFNNCQRIYDAVLQYVEETKNK